MTKPIIKICGIRDPEIAKQAAVSGANLIGIVFHPQSPRYVPIHKASAISDAVIKAGASPVAVFVNHNSLAMRKICEATNIRIVQLHGEISRSQHQLLPDYFQKIYVQPVTADGKLQTDAGLRTLNPNQDLILVDNINPGQGRMINHSAFHYDLPFRWLLAGGLSPSTVANIINFLQPDGVDVSSGVETSKGIKDIFLIQKFIRSVRGDNHDA